MKAFKVVFVILFLVVTYNQTSLGWGEKKTLKELTDSAPFIVKGTVTEIFCRQGKYLEQNNFIYTYIKFLLEKPLKGNIVDKIITIKVPGGKIGDHAIVGENTINFLKDESAILFLIPIDGMYYKVYSLSGKLSVCKNNGSDVIDCSSLKKDDATELDPNAKNKVDDVLDTIKKYLSEKGGERK